MTINKPLLLGLAAASLALGACSKSCHCTRYDFAEDVYSESEVEDLGGSCSDLKYMYSDPTDPDPYRYYTLCEWKTD